jgi:hypothetical protein
MGGEPVWTIQPAENRISRLSKAFSWYNYFYGKKDARDMIVNYLEAHDRKADVRTLRGIPDSAIRLTTGWLCRMSMVGLELTDTELLKLENHLKVKAMSFTLKYWIQLIMGSLKLGSASTSLALINLDSKATLALAGRVQTKRE